MDLQQTARSPSAYADPHLYRWHSAVVWNDPQLFKTQSLWASSQVICSGSLLAALARTPFPTRPRNEPTVEFRSPAISSRSRRNRRDGSTKRIPNLRTLRFTLLRSCFTTDPLVDTEKIYANIFLFTSNLKNPACSKSMGKCFARSAFTSVKLPILGSTIGTLIIGIGFWGILYCEI